MSTGRRLAKRSILGTRVSAPGQDGRYYPAIIQATKTISSGNNNNNNNVFSVVFDDKSVGEFNETELIGPGFQTVAGVGVELKPGQKVFATHQGREVFGTVVRHWPTVDEVHINVVEPKDDDAVVVELIKKLDEVRLLESRKSARLHVVDSTAAAAASNNHGGGDQVIEFVPITLVATAAAATDPGRKRPTSHVIDVPTAQHSNRKRRPSSPEDFDVMDDCAAAMVLMSLSCSPKSPRLPDNGIRFFGPQFSGVEGLQLCSSWAGDQSSYLQSPGSSSGASSWKSNRSGSGPRSTPSPPSYSGGELSASAPASFAVDRVRFHEDGRGGCSDEGIDVDDSSDEYVPRKRRHSKRTVFKCTWPGCEKITRRCPDIEEHVRKTHLRKMDDLEAHEEEFYFTEIQLPLDTVTDSFGNLYTSSPPTLSHMDMARPPHEDPEYHKHVQNSPPKSVRLSPKSNSILKISSMHRKARGDSKKCRKVYGMDNRELWCTQCKWKKACSRFMD